MKKRIVCVLLTLIMLLGLIPVGASAASREISEAAITVLKQMTTFKNKCYHYSGSEFRTGYGTVCEEEHHFNTAGVPDNTVLDDDDNIANIHTITEKQADTALRKTLTTYDEKVNAFASANGLSLKQHQHDALVVFSYNAGTGWMNGNGVLKSVIINKGTTNEMLNAMNLWTNNADLSRRQVEVNMYMNGVYSNYAPGNYGSVVYDPDGGTMPQDDNYSSELYTYYYDTNGSLNHPVTPTRNGYKFLGWYEMDGSITSWVPMLTGSQSGKTLTALWQKSYNPVKVNYQLHKDHLASKKVYRSVNGEYTENRTEILSDYMKEHDNLFWVNRDVIDKNGVRWSQINIDGTAGWVKIGAATDNDSYKDNYGTVIATATVTVNGYLNLRKDAGTDAAIVGALAKNDTVNIYEIKTVNGHQWGLSKSGWLCLTYTRVIMKDDASISDEGRLSYAFTGVAKNGDIDVHVEAGDNTEIATYIDHNDYEQDLEIESGKTVTVTNLAVYNNKTTGVSETWAKVTWMHNEKKYTDKKKTKKEDIQVQRSGWVKLAPEPEGDVPKVELHDVHYTVVADSVNVRDNWGDASNLIMSLNKGVQVKVNLVALIGENMWGRVKVKRDAHVDDAIIGYVNLASKYFSRDDAPTIEDDNDSLDGMIATVINTDSLRVRKSGATYAQQIGRLTRGTTVAVWEYDDGWYKVDSNKNGTYDYKEDGWCSEDYLDVRKGNVNGSSTVTDSNGNQYETDGTGKGIVANTYSGVNVRTGPGTAYAANGKLLPGTVVEILETANAGKWGRVSQGWICMDYVTMVSYNEVIPENAPDGGSYVESFDKAEKTTTTAVYTGRMDAEANVYRNPTKDEESAELIRTAAVGENITIYELAKVTEVVQSDDHVEGNVTTNTTITTTSYWARINDGWVEDPEICVVLNALDEKVHTQTGATKLNVRKAAEEDAEVMDVLVQGDQVDVTALSIDKDKVWGRIETSEGTGWVRLDYMSEGAIYVKAPVQNNTNNNTNEVVLGQGSSTGGYVDNSTGYRYTGKIIRANEVNVRANPSTSAAKTTSLKNGAALVIYETTIAENMAWGRCDAGWVYLYYVDLTPVVNGAVDARVVYQDNTIIYTDVNCSAVAGSYSRMSTIDIYEIVGKMARTEQGWVNTDNLL